MEEKKAEQKKSDIELIKYCLRNNPDRLEELANSNDRLCLLIAENEETPSELLAELGNSKNKNIRKAVVSNPNTPTKTLFILGEHFPQELLDNPILDLLYLENCNFINNIPFKTLCVLLQQENVPKFLLKYATKHRYEEIKEIAKLHVNLSGEIREGWHEVAQDVIKYMEHKNIGSCFRISRTRDELIFLSNLYEFIELDKFKNIRYCRYVAMNKNIPISLLEKLAIDRDVRANVARNPNTPIKILEKLATDEDSNARASVARNPNTPVKILEKLASDKDNRVLCDVAGNHHTPIKILEKLANDKDSDIRASVAGNPNTPIKILEKLANDKDIDVRASVADNPNTPVTILRKLAIDRDIYVRVSIALNPKTPIDIIKQLIQNEDCEFLQHISSSVDLPIPLMEQLSLGKYHEVHSNIAIQSHTPISILERLNIDEKNLSFYYAGNNNTPIDILKKLATNESSLIRQRVAKNKKTSIDILEKLATDKNSEVRQNVAINPNCNHKIKETIFKNFANEKEPSFSRLVLFLSDYAESSVLTENYNSISWLERYAIAQNFKTPKDTLKLLAKDSNRVVRATAKENLQKKQLP